MSPVDDLVALLALEPIEVNIFRGRSPDDERQRVFGGQVAGQALVAASRTVDEPQRHVHSLHAYFLRPGDPAVPILYEVDRIRDGRSFTTRRVVAIQHGRAIFNLQCSFHIAESGLDYQVDAPHDWPDPETLPDWHERLAPYKDQIGADYDRPRPIDLRYASGDPMQRKGTSAQSQGVWLRANGPLPDDPPACAWRASTTRCGSTDRSAPTSGCSTTSASSAPPPHAVWRVARSSPAMAAWW